MSAAYFIVPERDVPGLDVFVDGKPLAHVRPKQLDRLAAQAGVRPLMEYYSLDPEEAASFLEDEGIEPPEGGFPPAQWFSAEDGLVTVRGLIALLESNPAAIPNVRAVIDDLLGFEEVLRGLASANVRWHLAVDT
jgi:hypothetical protein